MTTVNTSTSTVVSGRDTNVYNNWLSAGQLGGLLWTNATRTFSLPDQTDLVKLEVTRRYPGLKPVVATITIVPTMDSATALSIAINLSDVADRTLSPGDLAVSLELCKPILTWLPAHTKWTIQVGSLSPQDNVPCTAKGVDTRFVPMHVGAGNAASASYLTSLHLLITRAVEDKPRKPATKSKRASGGTSHKAKKKLGTLEIQGNTQTPVLS
jgi:hypothetical protein